MNFAAPSMLWWLALAVPIVGLYVLKVRLRRVPVSTLMFWERVYQEKAPRSLFERLRHLASLLLQLAFLALVVFALADPYLDSEVRDARRLVLVLDTSAGMAAADGADGETRLDRAKRAAGDLLDSLRYRDAAAVLTAGTEPAVACGTTNHVRTLADAVDGAVQTDGPTAVPAAVALARRLLADAPAGRVVLFTDGGFDGADDLAAADDVDLVAVGRPAANAAVTAFQARRSLVDPVGYEILCEVSNLSDEPAELRLDLDLAGVPVDVVPLELAAGEVWRRTFEKTSPTGGLLVARLVRGDAGRGDAGDGGPGDALPADDTARAVLPGRPRAAVVLVTPGNLFLEQVFRANPLVDLTVTDAVPDPVPDGAVLVLHRAVPATLPPGPVLVVDPRTSTDLWAVGEPLAAPVVAGQEEDADLLRYVTLTDLSVPGARSLTPTAAAESFAEPLAATAAGDPLLLAFRRPPVDGDAPVGREPAGREPAGRVLVVTADLDRGDLPLRTAFPILAVNALNWFRGESGELREAAAAGAVVAVPLPDGADSADWSVVAPDGTAAALPPGLGEVRIGPLDHAGLWRVVPSVGDGAGIVAASESAGWPTGTVTVACNLTDPAESDLRRVLKSSGDDRPPSAAGGRPWWFLLTAAALVLVVGEWWLYQRRFVQ